MFLGKRMISRLQDHGNYEAILKYDDLFRKYVHCTTKHSMLLLYAAQGLCEQRPQADSI